MQRLDGRRRFIVGGKLGVIMIEIRVVAGFQAKKDGANSARNSAQGKAGAKDSDFLQGNQSFLLISRLIISESASKINMFQYYFLR